MQYYEAIIIGAGAAGLMCAGAAAPRGRRVLVLEKNAKIGQKIRISGGGRANFTNLHCSPNHFLSDNPKFCVSALKRYTHRDFIALVERYQIAYHEKALGQLFCDESAQQIIDMLAEEAQKGETGTEIRTSVKISRVQQNPGEGGFSIHTNQGDFSTGQLVIATGGPSIPKMGATGFAYDIALQFGHSLIEPRPGLVPFTFDTDALARTEGLSGVSVDSVCAIKKTRFEDALLFTHRGVSGPAILQISSYWKEGDTVQVNLCTTQDVFTYLKGAKETTPKRDVSTSLGELLPNRLAQRLVEETGCRGRLADQPDRVLRRVGERVNAWRVTPNGTEGARTAEVFCGGVNTKELSSQTMESRKIPGLYFIGEGVDVTGHLGGHNFQWAWSSGWACGQAL